MGRTVSKSSPVSEAPSPKSIADSRKVADHVSHAFSVDDGRRSPPPVNTAIRRTTSQVQEKVTGITQDLTQRAMTSVIARPNTALSQSTNLASRLGDVHIPTPLDGLQTADQATGGAISRFSDGETYGTATRRLLRDSAGVSPAIAQNAGDIVHGGVELALLCGARGEGAAAKGAGKAFGRVTRTVQTVSRPKRVLAISGRTAEVGSSIPKRAIPSAASKIEYHPEIKQRISEIRKERAGREYKGGDYWSELISDKKSAISSGMNGKKADDVNGGITRLKRLVGGEIKADSAGNFYKFDSSHKSAKVHLEKIVERPDGFYNVAEVDPATGDILRTIKSPRRIR